MGFVNLILLGTLRGYLHSLIIFEVDLVIWLDIKIVIQNGSSSLVVLMEGRGQVLQIILQFQQLGLLFSRSSETSHFVTQASLQGLYVSQLFQL